MQDGDEPRISCFCLVFAFAVIVVVVFVSVVVVVFVSVVVVVFVSVVVDVFVVVGVVSLKTILNTQANFPTVPNL
jgi:hypothetical protein